MSADLLSALCLVLVIEGIFLFVAPAAWKDAVVTLVQFSNRHLRWIGLTLMLLGIGLLHWLRG